MRSPILCRGGQGRVLPVSGLGDHPGMLVIPPIANAASEAREVLCAWVSDDDLHVSLRASFDTPNVWGVLLADLARQAAQAFAKDGICYEQHAMSQIKRLFDAEWNRPADRGITEPVQ